jgi:hypothetical protein
MVNRADAAREDVKDQPSKNCDADAADGKQVGRRRVGRQAIMPEPPQPTVQSAQSRHFSYGGESKCDDDGGATARFSLAHRAKWMPSMSPDSRMSRRERSAIQ